MNYSNVFGHTKRQFDMTMNREKISVADYYNSDVKYDVFFRRNNRSTTPQSKVRFFYAQSTPITIGTIFVLNGENYIVTSQDGIESDIYFTSIANKCDFSSFLLSTGRVFFALSISRPDIMDNDLLEEMKTFVAEDNGAFNAVVGSHDDLVSACWLCIAGMKSAFWYPF